MPPKISDRYRLEMRLGRDGDIEEWLATDTSLERPVLIRSLGPDSSGVRREEFIGSVSSAAKTSHQHLARVYGVEVVEGGAYSVSEWAGGATLADRVAAGRVIDLEEFLPNASGLAGALAALHALGSVHGNIDLSAVSYSVAHPAKLGSFGRPRLTDAEGDVRALAAILEAAVTGSAAAGGPPPSETIDGFPRSLDRILRSGQSGRLSAGELEKALLAAPTPRLPQPEPRSGSRRLLMAAGGLVVVAVGLVALGALFTGGGGPILPVTPTTAGTDTTATQDPGTTLDDVGLSLDEVSTFDPFGEGGENDDLIPSITDGNNTTFWRTERYQDLLSLIKPGVGLRFNVTGIPSALELTGVSPGTQFDLYWAAAAVPQLSQWERIVGGRASEGVISLTLPARTDGHWLLWLTDLPGQPDGTFQAAVAEVAFLP